jgi:hypothetical protein
MSDYGQSMMFAAQMETHFNAIYVDLWNITIGDIINIDSRGAAGNGVASDMDSADNIDKRLHTPDGTITLAQRVIKQMKKGGGHFPIRVRSRNGNDSEFQLMYRQWQNDKVDRPSYYGFAIGASHRKEACIRKGFSEFYLIDYDSLLTALFDLQMPPRWVYDHSEKSHNDQSKVRFYDTGDLIDAECVVNIVDG